MLGKEENPFIILEKWLAEAEASKIEEPTAMNLATVGSDGRPSSRMVLLKNCDEHGLIFYTNLGSKKAQEIRENPSVALNFHWQPLRKQIRVEGKATLVSNETADEYFASRARKSQLGAWASKQSKVMSSPMELEKRLVQLGTKFGVGAIPRPDFWSGFIVKPDYFEFWHDKAFRLHDRWQYRLEGQEWKKGKLFP